MAKNDFHISDIKAYTQCPLKWYFSSHMGLGLSQPKEPSAYDSGSMWLGTEVHLGLQEIDTDGEIKSTISSEATDIINDYLLEAKEYDELIGCELDATVPFFGDYNFSSRLDKVVKHEDRIWIIDYKVTGQDFESYGRYLANQDTQVRAYSYIGKLLYGSDFGGVIFTLIKNKPFDEPVILRSGGLSKAKSQFISWDRYKDWIQYHGLNLSDYTDMESTFTPNRMAHTIPVRLSNNAISNFHKYAVDIAHNMLYNTVTPSPNPVGCRGCKYAKPCNLYMDVNKGTAIHYVKQHFEPSDYTKRNSEE